MPRFIFGDELGELKLLQFSSSTEVSSGEPKCQVKVIEKTSEVKRSIQALSITSVNDDPDTKLLTALYSDGSGVYYSLGPDDALKSLHEWKDRFGPDQKYISLGTCDAGVYSCTSGGALRFTPLPKVDPPASPSCSTSLPNRLHDWRLSQDTQTFAYGGHEVDLSLWDTERSFAASTPSAGQKRQSNATLFPAEIWRAKNVKNDSLGLRQPVYITSLAYLSPSSSKAHQNLLTGTLQGDVRRYDTRVARRPTADWRGLGRVGGVRRIEKGRAEYEAFISDNGGNLFALDLRNGKIAYGYKGITGAVPSMALSPSLLASVSLDRFARIHSTFPLPSDPRHRQEKKGEVIDKVFIQSLPTVIVWDGHDDSVLTVNEQAEKGDEDIWNAMESVGEVTGDDALSDSEAAEKRRRIA